MLTQELDFLKKEMEARKIDEELKNIIGSFVYYPTQKELNFKISESNLENIDVGVKKHNKKETLLDALTKIIKEYDIGNNKSIIPKIKRVERSTILKIDTSLHDYTDEIDHEKNIYFKKYKGCSPIKRNSFKQKVFSNDESSEIHI